MSEPEPQPTEPLDLHDHAERSWWLRLMLTGRSEGGDAASAVYGTILAASVLIVAYSSSSALPAFLGVVGTGIVFWLAHAHVTIMRRVVRDGQHVDARVIRHALTEEWPLVQASLTPAAPLVLAMFGLIEVWVAVDIGVGLCFLSLIAWGIVVARAADLTRRQTLLAIGINAAFGVLLMVLKVLVH